MDKEIVALIVENDFIREKIETHLTPEQKNLFEEKFKKYTLDKQTPEYISALLMRNKEIPTERIVVHRYWNELKIFPNTTVFLNWLQGLLPNKEMEFFPKDKIISALLISYGNKDKFNAIENLKAPPILLCSDPVFTAYGYSKSFRMIHEGEDLFVATDIGTR